MVDKNLFLYDLAVVAIFKDEGKYLKEWLDYHLLAGVEHFYLYNNDSSDDYQEVLKPYIEKNLVTLTDCPGRLMMYPAYNDAIEKYRFDCRYMAFVDLDEFIFPKTGQIIPEAVDEILSRYPKVAALGINWQIFGSNGEEKADYTRGVLERFTRRALSDWLFLNKEGVYCGNIYIKSIVNPRKVEIFLSPHYAFYFGNLKSINTDGNETNTCINYPVCFDKIVINHYFTKSKEEYEKKKMPKGSICLSENPYIMETFYFHDRNDEFDDDILKYRAAREETFSLEIDDKKTARLKNALIEALTQGLPFETPPELLIDKLETFLTCRALAEKLGDKAAEEYVLLWICHILNKNNGLTYAELQLFIATLPDILARPFPSVKNIVKIFSTRLIPALSTAAKDLQKYNLYKDIRFLQRLLESFNR